MFPLANNDSKEQLLKKLATEEFERKTLSFYRYVKIEDPQSFRDELFVTWSKFQILGRVYVSQEGINAQINVPEPHWREFIAHLEDTKELKNMPLKIAIEEGKQGDSFYKLTIKVKKQIVADGLPIDSYNIENVGTHLNAEEFNTLADSEETMVVDMRNSYESEIGHFENAFCPEAETFNNALREVKEKLARHKSKKLLLYCTGGIRCEKASAYLKNEGFKDVYQLYGGIINYAHEVRDKGLESKFKGKNFVFDERRAERITPDILSECHQCGAGCDNQTNCSNEMCNLLFIQCDTCRKAMDGCCSAPCQEIVNLPMEERLRLRKSQTTKPKMFYRKGMKSLTNR